MISANLGVKLVDLPLMTIQPTVGLLEIASDIIVLLLDGCHQPVVLFSHLERVVLKRRAKHVGHQTERPVTLGLLFDKADMSALIPFTSLRRTAF
jgi:hypothetical protein